MTAPLRFPLVLAGLAALALGACAPADRAPPATTPETVESQPATAPEPAPPPKPKITTAELLGRADTWVVAKLGEPAFRRTDRHANIWQYKNGTCVLNLFLYDDVIDGQVRDGGPAHVRHFDARDTQGQATDRDACLSALQE